MATVTPASISKQVKPTTQLHTCHRCNTKTVDKLSTSFYTQAQAKTALIEAGYNQSHITIIKCGNLENPTKPFFHVIRKQTTRDTVSRKCTCINHLGKQKRLHPTKQSALNHAVTTRYMKYNGKVKTYQCPTTNKWHITTMPSEHSYIR